MTDQIHEYDYAQPITIGSSVNIGGTPQQPYVKIENPFNTDAEACVEFYWSSGTSGIVSFVADNTSPPQSIATLGINPSDNNNAAVGYVLPCPLISGFHSEYYFPVKQFLALYANFTGAGFVLIIGWRRVRQTYVPPVHPTNLNEPTA